MKVKFLTSDEHLTVIAEFQHRGEKHYVLEYPTGVVVIGKASCYESIPDERWEDVTGECQVQDNGRLLTHSCHGNSRGFISVLPSLRCGDEHYRFRKVQQGNRDILIVERKVRG